MKCCKTLLGCLGKKDEASGVLCRPLMGWSMSLPLGFAMQKSPQFQIWDSLSARQMRWWYTRRSIHCFWSVTKPCLSAQVRREKLLEASTGPLWVLLGHYQQASLPRNHHNARFGVHSQPDKGGDGTHWESSIASEVLQNLASVLLSERIRYWRHIHASYGLY